MPFKGTVLNTWWGKATSAPVTGENSRWHSGQYRVYIYIDRVGHFTLDLSLIPGKSYKLRTSETYDVIGHDLFMYDIYLNYKFG